MIKTGILCNILIRVFDTCKSWDFEDAVVLFKEVGDNNYRTYYIGYNDNY